MVTTAEDSCGTAAGGWDTLAMNAATLQARARHVTAQ